MNQEQLTKEEKLSTIIELCDDIDGEALQYIIRSVGMEYQMLRQLVMMAPTYMLEDLIEEKMSMDDETVHLRRDDAKEEWDFLEYLIRPMAPPEDFFID